MKTILTVSTFMFVSAMGLGQSLAQIPNETEATAPTPAPVAPTPDSSLDSRLQSLEQQLKELKEQNQGLASQLAEVQDTQNQSGAGTSSDLGKTKIFGFFDMSLYRYFYAKGDSVLKGTLPGSDKSSFIVSSLNVYLSNQITEKLKFLGELRYTYQPLGKENSIETYGVMPNGSTVNLGSNYSRTDTSVTDPISVQTYRLGGVSMERVQVTYTLNDYLGVTAGRFLTPYGIWNVDHGSPVILMVRAPILQTQQLIPSQQTGLQLFGRAFLTNALSLDYAGTVSNGRGPVDSLMDYDENKGLGLRWRLNVDLDDLSISAGQYGYTGKYTDISKTLYAGPGSGDLSVQINITNQNTETSLANDFVFKWKGLRFQTELVLRRVKYQVPPKLDSSNFNGFPTLAGQYNAANFLSYAYYGLLAYELPDSITGGSIRLTPFVYYERMNLNDTVDSMAKAKVYSAGLNLRPYRNLVLKLEYDLVDFSDLVSYQLDGTSEKRNPGRLQGFNLQLAVTF